MHLSPIKRVPSILLVLAFICQPLLAQEPLKDRTAETSATVPALRKFHIVIFKIWHTAWPNKDDSMLIALFPEVEKGVIEVAQAELPGILRDKKEAWREGVKKLQEIVHEYKTAIETKQKQPLLDAAEKLHAQYEALVRVIRPPLRELDDFHAVLYMVYHYYMPQNSLEEIKGSIGKLQEKMIALNHAVLSPRFKGKEESFRMARNQLDQAVSELAVVVRSNDIGKIKTAIETIHTSYKTLQHVFE
jgi:NADH dehydrogenase/NADH:ubiquinone oxidoreductase subunit G